MRTRRNVKLEFVAGITPFQLIDHVVSGLKAWKLEAVAIRSRGIAGLAETFCQVTVKDSQGVEMWQVRAPVIPAALNSNTIMAIGMPNSTLLEAINNLQFTTSGLPDLWMYENAIITAGAASTDVNNTLQSLQLWLSY